jgi:hypothetical protein
MQARWRTFDFAQAGFGASIYCRCLHTNKSGDSMKPTIAESLKFALTAGAMVAAIAYITSAGGAVAAEPSAAAGKSTLDATNGTTGPRAD